MSLRIEDFDFSVDLLRHLIWQYDEAFSLTTLLRRKQRWYDVNQEKFWSDWYRDVFNLLTANDFGLSVWSRILDQPLVFDAGAAPANKPAFGFGEFHRNFGRGNFSRGAAASLALTTEQKRLVLRLRYFQLMCRGTVPEINRAFKVLFEDASVYVLNPQDMTAVIYVFDKAPSSSVKLILEKFDLFPRPAGVGIRYIVSSRDVFGFGQYHKNFNNGNFVGEA